jgi:hypothetical protein
MAHVGYRKNCSEAVIEIVNMALKIHPNEEVSFLAVTVRSLAPLSKRQHRLHDTLAWVCVHCA